MNVRYLISKAFLGWSLVVLVTSSIKTFGTELSKTPWEPCLASAEASFEKTQLLPLLSDPAYGLRAELEAVLDQGLAIRLVRRPGDIPDLEKSLNIWRNRRSTKAEKRSAALNLTSLWLNHGLDYILKNGSFSWTKKVLLLVAFCQLIHERTMDEQRNSQWVYDFHITHEEHAVIAGPLHRFVILKNPSSPIYKGSIPESELDLHVSRNTNGYYDRWSPFPLRSRSLRIVSFPN